MLQPEFPETFSFFNLSYVWLVNNLNTYHSVPWKKEKFFYPFTIPCKTNALCHIVRWQSGCFFDATADSCWWQVCVLLAVILTSHMFFRPRCSHLVALSLKRCSSGNGSANPLARFVLEHHCHLLSGHCHNMTKFQVAFRILQCGCFCTVLLSPFWGSFHKFKWLYGSVEIQWSIEEEQEEGKVTV